MNGVTWTLAVTTRQTGGQERGNTSACDFTVCLLHIWRSSDPRTAIADIALVHAALKYTIEHDCYKISIYMCVLFQRDLTTKSSGLGLLTFEMASFMTNCTSGTQVLSAMREKKLMNTRTCPVPPWYKIEPIGWQAGNRIDENPDGAERMIEPRKWCNPATG